MSKKNKRVFLRSFLAIVLILSYVAVFANNFIPEEKAEETNHEAITHESDHKKFQAGEFILGHIGDSYDWHIITIGENHVSLPLPIILYHKQNGLSVFMSTKFHHGHDSYNGYMIAHDGPMKGKIVCVDEENFIDEEMTSDLINISLTKNTVAMMFSMILMIWIFTSVARSYVRRKGLAPKGLQSMIEPLIIFVRDDIAIPSLGEKKYMKFMPFLLTLFFFIFLNNLLGLIPILPGGANITGNIAITCVLALFTFVITTFIGNKNYWLHIVNTPGVPWWLKFPVPLMPIVEIMGVLTKPIVLMVRLFANITAGHIIALGFFSLIFIFGELSTGAGYGVSIVSVAFTIFMTLLELLVAFIQAYVFTLLSALYFGMATEEHH